MGETSISCREETRTRLDELRGDKYKNWDAFLNHLADAWESGTVDVYKPGDPNPVDTVEGPDKRLVVHEATAEELARLEELLEKVPARTADEVEDRFK